MTCINISEVDTETKDKSTEDAIKVIQERLEQAKADLRGTVMSHLRIALEIPDGQ